MAFHLGRFTCLLASFLLTLFLAGTSLAVSANDAFDPNANGEVLATVVQPDGKIIVAGAFTAIGGQTRNHLARLNSDGSVDTTFNPDANSPVHAVALQADGRIIVAGDFTALAGETRSRIARLNSDGSLDAEFSAGADSTVNAVAVQGDGKILVGGQLTSLCGVTRNGFGRLNADGTLDTGFHVQGNGYVDVITLQPNGKILVAGSFTTLGGGARSYLARVEANGILDASFNLSLNGAVRGITVQPDGKMLIGGEFTSVRGQTRNRMARVSADGSLDASFNPDANGTVNVITLQADGRMFVGGNFGTIAGGQRANLAQLNGDGTLSGGITAGTAGRINSFALQPDGRVVIAGEFNALGSVTRNNIARLYADGTLESIFHPDADANVLAIAVQPDGKILAGGPFTAIAGTTRRYLVRLNADGSADSSFNPDADWLVYSLAVQPDGKIVAGGGFTSIGSAPQNHIARLNPDGSADGGFTPYANNDVTALALQPDRKIVIGGLFSVVNVTERYYMARLNADGTLDPAFYPGVNNAVSVITLQPDGKILVGGSFTRVGSATCSYLARLNPDGTLDASFNAGVNGSVSAIAVQPDGKILIGGAFSTAGAAARSRIARLNADGTLDASFDPGANNSVSSIVLQPDGRILVGGAFTAMAGSTRNSIARLNADGSLDNSFNPDVAGGIYGMTSQGDGDVIVGGSLSSVGGAARSHIARISAGYPALQSLAASADGSRVTWLRSGAGPELERVTFERSSDLVTWTGLGSAQPVAGGWQVDGVSLPIGEALYLRARGVAKGGERDGSGSLIESVKLVYLPPAAPVAEEATFVSDDGFTVTWQPVPGAAGYIFDLATDPGFTNFVGLCNAQDVRSSTTVVASFSSGRRYYYRVRAYNTGNVSAYSNTVAVEVPDTIAPASEAWPESGTYSTAPNLYLFCSDGSGSGCAATYYCLGAGCTPSTLYQGYLTVSGSTELRFYSVDAANNAEPVRSASYTIVPAFQLFVFEDGTGSGTVSGGAIQCASGSVDGCFAEFPGGSVVTLTATPSPGSLFAGWSGACAGASGYQCSVTVDDYKDVGATFTSVALPAEVLAAGNIGPGVSINALGESVWSEFDPATGYYQIFSSQRGRLTSDLVDHDAPAINTVGDVVWYVRDLSSTPPNIVQGIIAGKRVNLAYAWGYLAKPDINDRGEVIWSEYDSLNNYQLHSNLRGQLTGGTAPVDNLNAGIDNAGTIIYEANDKQGHGQIMRLAAGSSVPVAVTDNLAFRHAPASNDSGEVIWAEAVPGSSLGKLVSTTRGVLVPSAELYSTDLNGCGDVLYSAPAAEGGVALYRLGNNAPCVSFPATHDTMATAVPTALADIFTDVADSATAPVGWYRFEGAAGDTIHISVNYDSRAPNLIEVGLYDGMGNLLSAPTAGAPLMIEYPAIYSGSYYLKVAAQSGRFGYSVSLGKYSSNCGSGPCREELLKGTIGSASINALGEYVWSGFDSEFMTNQIYSSRRGRLTADFNNHDFPAINDLGDVVWVTDDFESFFTSKVEGVIGGKRVTVAAGMNYMVESAINNRREVVWSEADGAGVYQIQSNLRGQLTAGATQSREARIDNSGNVVFVTTVATQSGNRTQVMKLAAGSSTPVALSDDLSFRIDPVLNDSGEMMWVEKDPILMVGSLKSSSRGVLVPSADLVQHADMNSCGDVLFTVIAGTTTTLYRLGESAPCVSFPGAHDSRESAATVAMGDVFTGAADAAGTATWYRFEAGAGGTIDVEVNYDGRAPNRLEIGLYDAQGNLLSGPTSATPLAIVTGAPYGGSYFLKVTGAGGRIGYTVNLADKAFVLTSRVPEYPIPFDPYGSASIDSLGEILYTKLDGADNSQIISKLRGQLSFDPVTHMSPVQNDIGDLAWVERDCSSGPCSNTVKGIIGGQPVTIATFQGWMEVRLGISNGGEVVYSQEEPYPKRRVYSSRRGPLTGELEDCGDADINNRGDVVYAKYDEQSNSAIYLLRAGSLTSELVTRGDGRPRFPKINDNGEVIWVENGQMYSNLRGHLQLENDSIVDGDINNCGDIIYQGVRDYQWSVLYRYGNSAPCLTNPGAHDSADLAAPVTVGETAIGLADTAAPASWYRFEGAAGDSVHVRVNFDNRAPNSLVFALYDAAGNQVADPAGPGAGRIDYTLPAGGVYFVKVEVQGGPFGYAVSVQRDAVPVLKLTVEGESDGYFATFAELFGRQTPTEELKLFCRSGDLAEDVAINQCGKIVTLNGGYDAGFATPSGKTRLSGKLKLTCGKLVVNGLTLR